MDGLGSLDSFIFEDLRFDRAAGCLVRTDGSGVGEPVALGSRALALLALLVERQGQLLSKDAIFAAVWPGIVVGDGNLTVQISALRRVLDDGRTQGSCIQTIPGRGYRFIPAVTRVVGEDSVGDRANIAAAGRAVPAVRRLTAILAADVAEYSRLMGADEEGTHERLQGHLRELIDPKITEHRGRIVRSTGDGLLAEFASVVDAVRCAVAIQRGMVDRERELPEDMGIGFRIGINLGDVIVEEHDIFGDGVNVAARLEALAEPGGVLVSNTVYEHVRDRLPFTFDDMGEQSVKNIARPVRVYALRLDAVANPRGPGALAALSISQPAVAPRLSIVVLPFANLGNDPEQQYFADGITEDLTTDLSRIEGMRVISRNTAFTYRGKQLDTKQIGRELCVRYVLEGSVRRSGSRVRVSAQLIDAVTDVHLWAERFDGDTGDLFALQDEITSRIAVALNLELTVAEAARPTDHPDALDYILRGRAARLRPNSRDSLAQAVSFFEHALAIDPRSVEAQSRLATTLASRAMDELTDSPAADIARAEGLVQQAVTASPRSSHAHYAKAQVLRAQAQLLGLTRRYDEAIAEYRTAFALDRSLVFAIAAVGRCKLAMGSLDEVIPLIEEAISLSPRDPYICDWYLWIGAVHLLQTRTDDAIVWLEKARRANPDISGVHGYLAAAYALNGEGDRAAAELAEARRLASSGIYSSIARLRARSRIPKRYESVYFAGLRKAGMPEE